MDLNFTEQLIDNIREVFRIPSDVDVNIHSLIDSLSNPYVWMTIGFNALIFLIVIMGVRLVIKEYKKHRLTMRLRGELKVKKKSREHPVRRIGLLDRYYEALTHTLKQKNKLHQRDMIFNWTIVGVVVIGVGLISFRQVLLGVFVPLILIDYTTKVIRSMEITDLEYMHMQMPGAIDAVLKSATKYGDLKSIFYEASRNLPYPIRSEFEHMARQMNSREAQDVLLGLKEKYDDIWINSFVFIMISMLDDSGRELGHDNLKRLGNMIKEENKLKENSVTEKKLSVNTNYVLAGAASIMGIVSATFTEAGRTFFFSTPIGLTSFIVGYALVLITIKINVRLSSAKNKK